MQREQRDVTGTAPLEEQVACLQAFAHTGLSPCILTVAPFTGEETEAQRQEGPAQVTQLVRGRAGCSPLCVGLPTDSRVTFGFAPCSLPLPPCSGLPSAVEGVTAGGSKELVWLHPRGSHLHLSPGQAVSLPLPSHPPVPGSREGCCFLSRETSSHPSPQTQGLGEGHEGRKTQLGQPDT